MELTLVLHVVELIAIGLLGLMALGAYHEIGRLEQRLSSEALLPPATRLRRGDPFSVSLGVPLPPRAFLVFMSYGCSGCVDLSRKLSAAQLPAEWSLVLVMRDDPEQAERVSAAARLAPGGFTFPPAATVLHDPERRWFRELGITAYPAAVAVVGGRMVDQEVGPNVQWFATIDQRRHSSARELLGVGGAS